MSSTINANLGSSSQEESLTARDKIINLVNELTEMKDTERQVNAELNQEVQVRTENESEASNLRRQLQLAELHLDNVTNRVNHVTAQLTETMKASEESQNICNNLENKLTTNRGKDIDLINALQKTKESSLQTNSRFDESANRLTAIQERMEIAERRSAIAEKRIASLETDIRHAYIEMKSLIEAKDRAQAREVKYLKEIADLQARLKAAQHRSDEAEADVVKLQEKIEKLHEKIAIERSRCARIEKIIADTSVP